MRTPRLGPPAWTLAAGSRVPENTTARLLVLGDGTDTPSLSPPPWTLVAGSRVPENTTARLLVLRRGTKTPQLGGGTT